MKFIRVGVVLVGLMACDSMTAAEWTTPQAPFRIHGNTYYVGSRGLTALLIASDAGHVLIDAPLEENVAMIEANIRTLGFRVEDVRMILNSHAHHDHAGGIAALAQRSGATVHASRASARMLRTGGDDAADPQHASATLYAPVAKVKGFRDGAQMRVGDIVLTAHLTPGHTPGSTTWTWRSCENGQCLDMVYADSLTAMASGNYRYSDPHHPERVADFRKGLKAIAALDCDVLITPHPEVSGFPERVARRDGGEAQALIDRSACSQYAETATARLDARIAEEGAATK
jgi:metallo-beta-lactamase class B